MREARDDIFWWRKVSVIEGYTSSRPPGMEQMVGDGWRETDRPVAFRHTGPDNKELKFKDRVFKR